MDTSPEYIGMCDRAIEIRRMWKMSAGDFIVQGEKVHVVSSGRIMGRWFGGGKAVIWLPQQDQLQEMVLSKELHYRHRLYGLLQRFIDFTRSRLLPSDQRLWSCEQLWLMYVMDEKYSKRWNGEGWVKL